MRVLPIAPFLLASATLLLQATATADIIRCSDRNGSALYTDSACPAGMRAVGFTSFPQSCSTEDCESRRARDLTEARERVRAEMERLATYRAERRKREIEDRWLEEARYEAELRSGEGSRGSADDVFYPAFSLIGMPSRCGTRCLMRLSLGSSNHGHRQTNGSSKRRDMRESASEPLHLPRMRAGSRRTASSGRLADNE